ncbi:hypothetical protein Hanom_Chr13g01222511 [Helianthus anomalus]
MAQGRFDISAGEKDVEPSQGFTWVHDSTSTRRGWMDQRAMIKVGLRLYGLPPFEVEKYRLQHQLKREMAIQMSLRHMGEG